MAAVFKDQEITEVSLLEKSKSLEDYQERELKALAEAATKKAGANAQGTLEVFMAPPRADYDPSQLGIDTQLKISFSPRRHDNKVIKLNGNLLERKDLQMNQIRFSELKTQQLRENVKVLQNIFIRHLLLQAAKEDGTNITGLLKSRVIIEDPTVSDQELNKFISEKGISVKATDQNMRTRLRSIVLDKKRQAMIAKFVKSQFASEQATVGFRPPTYAIPLSEKQALIRQKTGKEGSPSLFVFSDFLCGPCIQLAAELKTVREQLKDKVRIGFVHMFSESNWQSRLVAEASFCLNFQQPQLFWKFYDRVTRETASIDEGKIHEIAREIGADHKNFESCLLKQTFKDEVNNQLKYAQDLGVTTPPTVIIGDQVFTGSVTRDQLVEAITKLSIQPKKSSSSWFSFSK